MRTKNKKRAIVSILAIAFLASLLLAPSAKALNVTYNDAVWTALAVTGPDQTTPGNTESYTISASLLTNMSGAVHLRLWIYSNTQTLRILLDVDALATGNYIAGSSFIKSYQVVIPADAGNNKYVFAQIDAGTSHFTNFTLTIVQSPTYAELQTRVNQLQSNWSSIISQMAIIEANNTNLQTQVNNLTSEKAALQVQVNNLQGNNSALQAQLSILNGRSTELQSQLKNLQAEKAALQSQVSSLQVEKSNLQAQVADLQTNNAALESQVGDLQSNKIALQSLITNLQGNNTELLSQVNDLHLKVNNLQLNSTNLQAIVNTFSLQIAMLEEQVSDLQSQNSTTSILMYLAIFVAAVFIASTGYFLFVLLKRKKTTAEPSL